MGLDQYIYASSKKYMKPVDFIDFSEAGYEERDEVAYWRNKHGVQRWMKELYRSKGGDAPDFNGNPVQLNEDDILSFVASTISTDWSDLIPRRDLLWVGEALSLIQEGKTIYYNSSW